MLRRIVLCCVVLRCVVLSWSELGGLGYGGAVLCLSGQLWAMLGGGGLGCDRAGWIGCGSTQRPTTNRRHADDEPLMCRQRTYIGAFYDLAAYVRHVHEATKATHSEAPQAMTSVLRLSRC